MMRILLVDDEPLALDRLSTLLEGREGVSVVGRASNAAQAVEAVAAVKPDLLLLDISMPDRDGLSLARALATDPSVQVVFVTAFDQFAAEAFNVDAVDYLLKPVEPERLTLALTKAARRRSLPAEPALEQVDVAPRATGAYVSSLWVPKRNGFARVDVDTIEWIEAARDYVLIHTPTHSHILRATMDSLARQFDPEVMIRASRSAFVRRGAVTALERQGRDGLFLVLSDRACVRVGTTYAKVIESQLGFRAAPPA